MTQQEFDKTIEQLNNLADGIVARKRPDYTRENTDVLANFKESASMAGITPLQAWMVHMHKQFSALSRYVKNPTCNPSEPITDRFADLRNYLQLGYAIYEESNNV